MIKLSASKIKTYSGCSFYGYARYNLGLPSASNLGSDLGSLVHTVIECLSSKKKYEYVEQALILKDPLAVKPIRILVEKLLKQKSILTPENLEKVGGFLLTAFENDFFDEDAIDTKIEYEFDIRTDTYWIGGFLDKIKEMENSVVIIDYKSSKKKFQGEEISFNVQGLMYALVASKMYPDKDIEVQFMFLKFPKNPFIKMKYTKAQLEGFENYLGYISEHLSNFTIEKALADMASEGGRGRSWQCGKDDPFGVKEDGSAVWVCPYRFGFFYYEATKPNHKPISAYSKKELLKYEPQGYTITTKKYSGCPSFNRQ